MKEKKENTFLLPEEAGWRLADTEEEGEMGEGGDREWPRCYYSSRRVGTQSAARREAHCAEV